MSNHFSNIKEEPKIDIDEEEANERAPFAAGLGLHGVGSALPPTLPPQEPIQALNARGMPPRIRKKNKWFLDDDITKPEHDIKKRKMTPSKLSKPNKGCKKSNDDDDDATKKITTSSVQNVDRTVCRRIGFRLANMLKLPKAHKWVGYEFCYSYIDKPLFEDENGFENFLRESFPALSSRMLTRIEWYKVRKLMGKPRRMSQSFFNQERVALERRRQKIRLLQIRKFANIEFLQDLPNEIPLPLPIGTKVTARLRHPQDGMFTGSIDAFDSMSSIYRISFDRVGLGTHSVPDFEVVADESIESITLNSITKGPRPKVNSTKCGGLLSTNKNNTLLESDIHNNSELNRYQESIGGGFQFNLLEMIVRAKKMIGAKQIKLDHLKSMNAEAELLKSSGDAVPENFQQRYASILIGLENLNSNLAKYLTQIKTLSQDLTKEPMIAAMLTPSYLREQCKTLGLECVEKNNRTVQDESMLRLITDLATVMFVASNLNNDTGSSSTRDILGVCLEEGKSRLNPENILSFQKNVEVHLRHLDNYLQS